MSKVFIGGSRKLARLNDDIRKRLNNIIDKNYSILVGDANGMDKAVQKYLSDKSYRNVLVYCVGENCRNNIGQWETRRAREPNKLKDFHYYSVKDLEMIKDTDYGFMIWDAKSKGTLNNIINLLKENKTSIVYLSKDKKFYTLSSSDDLEDLLKKCDTDHMKVLTKKLEVARKLQKEQEELGFA